ncbi:TPA: hypothetical protein EYO12_02155 [Candidatus Saccharibacteria bacterium]|nr:hypothetical protein [Candidatus Saccharibacteria bacterium]HIO87519.1 hypothetical protein [Candidatus Saccharibacteria bacterium]
MKKLLLAAFLLMGVGAFFTYGSPAAAQSTECQVSGDYGGIEVNGNTVTGTFSMSGPEDCTETTVNLAVWLCRPEGCNENLKDQLFYGSDGGRFDYSDTTGYNRAHPVASITTNLPTTERDGFGCKIQIDLVRGSDRADPDHQYPEGPFYDERRMLAVIVDNPACEEPPEVVTETEVVRCNTETGEFVTVPEDEADDYADVNHEACRDTTTVTETVTEREVVRCNTENGEFVTVDEDDADDYADPNHEACKDEVVVTRTNTVVEREVTSLPNTGAGASLLAIPTLGGAISAFVKSKNGLLDAFLSK